MKKLVLLVALLIWNPVSHAAALSEEETERARKWTDYYIAQIEDPSTRRDAEEGLVYFGGTPTMIPSLDALARHEDPGVRESVARVLSRISSGGGVQNYGKRQQILNRLGQDRNLVVRRAADCAEKPLSCGALQFQLVEDGVPVRITGIRVTLSTDESMEPITLITDKYGRVEFRYLLEGHKYRLAVENMKLPSRYAVKAGCSPTFPIEVRHCMLDGRGKCDPQWTSSSP